jgi:hypothetical protein
VFFHRVITCLIFLHDGSGSRTSALPPARKVMMETAAGIPFSNRISLPKARALLA